MTNVNMATQPRTDRPAHANGRGAARCAAAENRPRANRRSAVPVAFRSPQGSAADLDIALLQERARIARDLHDGVAQTLYAIGLLTCRARELHNDRDADQVEDLFDRVVQLASDGQAELRALMVNLWADHPRPRDIKQALIELAADQEHRHGLQVRLALPPAAVPINADTADTLVQIAREALSNAGWHAGAGQIDLELAVGASDVVLLIVDDGRGFDPSLPRPGHFGLRSMRERAQKAGGIFQVRSAEGAGTRLVVRVPRETSA